MWPIKIARGTRKAATGSPHPVPGKDKHLSYYINIMTEARVSSYFIVAHDTAAIFKASTEQICECIGRWKSRGDEEADSINAIPEELDLDELTPFGARVLKLGEILAALQAQDPVAFCANVHVDCILGKIIPLAQDVAKLRRKLMRIGDGVMRDLKDVRTLAEIHGILTKVEEEVNVNEDYGNYVDSVTDSAMEFLPMTTSSQKSSEQVKCSRVAQLLQGIFSKNKNSSRQGNHTSTTSYTRSKTYSAVSEVTEIKLPSPSERPSDKQLQRIASTLTTQKPVATVEYILDPTQAKAKALTLSLEEQEELWKKLDIDNLDVDVEGEKSPRFESPLVTEELDDTEVKSIVEEQATKYFVKSDDDPASNNANQNQDISVMTLITASEEDTTTHPPQPQLVPSFLKTKNIEHHKTALEQSLKLELDECAKKLDSIGIPIDPDPVIFFDDLEEEAADPKTTLSYLTEYKNFVDQMHHSVGATMEQVRSVERSWLNITTRALDVQNFLKLGNLLAYVKQTIFLLNDPQFMAQVYPETKTNILNALDQVYREFHSCFLALSELAEVVSKDSFYLKELLGNLPKGDPIVYEFTSNPSLGSFDQMENSLDVTSTRTFVDIDAIFD